jgi:hypothetical protein
MDFWFKQDSVLNPYRRFGRMNAEKTWSCMDSSFDPSLHPKPTTENPKSLVDFDDCG